MDKNINSNQIQEILNQIAEKKFDDAIIRIKKLLIEFPDNKILNKLLASTYFNKMDILLIVASLKHGTVKTKI